VVASVRALEDLSEAEVVQSRNQGQTPGVVIVIHPPSFTPAPASIPTLDAQPIEPELPTQVDRSFDPYRGP
jgi:hypothetical protein